MIKQRLTQALARKGYDFSDIANSKKFISKGTGKRLLELFMKI